MSFIAISSAISVLSSSSLRNDLKQIRDCWFFLLLVCTLIVAIGVILEEADEFSFGKPKLDLEKGIFRPSWWNKRKKSIAWMGWLLIIWGIIGEGLFEAAISKADTMLQEFSDTLLAITTEQARDAADSAKRAREETDTISKRAAELDRDLEYAQWIISARHVVDVEGLTKELRKEFKGQTIVLKSYAGDWEAYALCFQLVGITKNAEMNQRDECGWELFRGQFPMVDIEIGASSIPDAERIGLILERQPGRIRTLQMGLKVTPVITVFIGAKRADLIVWPPHRGTTPKNKSSTSSNP